MGAYTIKRFYAILIISSIALGVQTPAQASPLANSPCISAGQTLVDSNVLLTCVKSGTKLIWKSGKSVGASIKKAPIPKISGTAQTDQTLKAVVGTWDSGVTLSYQWLKGGAAIDGANDVSYVPTILDLSARISVRVTGAKANHKSTAKTSLATKPVTKAKTSTLGSSSEKAFSKAVTPKISGIASVGSTLAADRGEWNSQGVKYEYKWLRNGEEIPSANASNYKLTEDDAGALISVAVTGSALGFKTTTLVSKPITAVSNLKKLPQAKMLQIQGDPIIRALLKAPSPWASNIAVSHQWVKDGQNIDGETSSTYRVTKDDEKSFISVRMTAFAPGFVSETVSSLSLGPISNIPLLKFKQIGSLRVSGDLIPGSTLTLTSAGWESDADLSTVWQRSGEEIQGETDSTYEIQSEDLGKTISAVVTASKPGFQSAQSIAIAGTVTTKDFSSAPTPVILGIAREGKTLSIKPSSIAWSNNAELSFQWLKNGQAIRSETDDTYTLSAADIGSVVSVSVTAKAVGYKSATRVSDTTGVIGKETLVGSAPIVTGVAIVGQRLTANPSYWEPGVTLSYQWFRSGVAIPGATQNTLLLTNEDGMKSVTVSITGTKTDYPELTLTSTPLSVVSTTLVSTPIPIILGTGKVGEPLVVDSGVWDSGVSKSFRWLKNGTPISGATLSTYTPVVSDVASTIAVTVTGTKSQFTSVAQTSVAITVLAGSLSSTEPQIFGTAKLDQTLSLSPHSWGSGVQYSYRWLADGTTIPNATSTNFKLTLGQVGKVITSEITGTKAGYTTETRRTAPTQTVIQGAFVNKPIPTVSGTPMVGKTLTASAGIWETGTSLSYQWMRNGTQIANATGLTYLLSPSDSATSITFRVTASKTGNETAVQLGPAIGPIASSVIGTQGTPQITGTAKVGLTLSGSIGTWEPGLTFSQQWRRNGTSISGATALNYTLVAADLGATITFAVTANNGYTTATRTSSATATVTAGVFDSAGVPSISGIARVGNLLTVSPGTWIPGPTFTYQWMKAGVAISGATSTSYLVAVGDLGSVISVKVTGTLSGYTSDSKVSAATSSVASGVITPAPTPVISGTPKVGLVLTAIPGSWMSGTTLAYQWRKNDTAITGATSSTYTIVEGDAGSNITVAVRASRNGYVETTILSFATVVLTPPKLPIITSKFSKISSFDISWARAENTTYSFSVLNPAGASVGSYSCASTSCLPTFTIAGLPQSSSAITYTLNYVATTNGGSISGSTTVDTYPKLNLSVTVNSIVKTGDQYVINFQAIPNWTYQFNNYGVYDNSGCGVMSPVYTSSPITVYLPRGTCTMELFVKDQHGNSTGAKIAASISQVTAPPPALAGTLSSLTATTSSTVGYTMTFSSFYPVHDYVLVIVNSANSVVTPAIRHTSNSSGDKWSGSKSGEIYFTGLAPGDYTIRGNFRSSSDTRYGYDQQASVVLGVVKVTQ